MSAGDQILFGRGVRRFQHDLEQISDQCDALFDLITEHEQAQIDNLRTAFLMMQEMGYTSKEAKEEFVRFQVEYDPDISEQPNTGECSQVRVHRRHQTAASSPGHKQSHGHRLTGSQRFGRASTLCVVVIPILFVVGLVAEIWFGYNPWGRADFIVRYVKAALYIGVWYALLSACMNTSIARAMSVLLSFAAMGTVVAWEPVVLAWGVSMFDTSWQSFWLNTQWCYWGLLTSTYLSAWCKLVRGPRYWIKKYGVG